MGFNKSLSCFLLVLFMQHTRSSSQQQSDRQTFRRQELTCLVPTNHVQASTGGQEDTCQCKPGKRGPIGPPGPRGIPGIKGEAGESATALVNRFRTRVHQLELQVATLKSQVLPTSCDDIRKFSNQSGVYTIYPYERNRGKGLEVFCDMALDRNGWMVFQRRVDASVSFDRNWAGYKNRFGDIYGNYWIGLETMHQITRGPLQYEARIDLMSWENVRGYAVYRKFQVGPESSKYTLTALNYSGNAGNSFGFHNGSGFRTKDRSTYCNTYYAGWWYARQAHCFSANLNGVYLRTRPRAWKGIIYNSFLYGVALKRSQISVRKVEN